MADREKLIERIEYFYVDVIEEFKEAEQQIINDSQFKSLFRKKDYDGNIAMLRKCKKMTQDIEIRDIKPVDEESKDVLNYFKKTIFLFSALCNAYIQLQVFLKKKSQKEEAKFSTYKDIFNQVQQCKDDVNAALQDLDIAYTDYTEDLEAGEDE